MENTNLTDYDELTPLLSQYSDDSDNDDTESITNTSDSDDADNQKLNNDTVIEVEHTLPQIQHYTLKKVGGKRIKQMAVFETSDIEDELSDYLDNLTNNKRNDNNEDHDNDDDNNNVINDLDEIINNINDIPKKNQQPRLSVSLPPLPPLIPDLDELMPLQNRPINTLKELINNRNRQKGYNDSLNSQYECNICGVMVGSELILKEHKMYAHPRYNMFESDDELSFDPPDPIINLCRCLRCNKIFNNDGDYHKHICSQTANGIEEDMMPVDPNGEYQCPICKNRYSTSNILGEHFIISHNDYSQLGSLDENIQPVGFPGFDILEELYMIKAIDNNKIKKIIKNKEICSVCCYNFRYSLNNYISNNNESETCYNSDSELIENDDVNPISKRKIKRSNSYPFLIKQNIPQRSIRDEQLLTVINKIRQKSIIPVMMICCDFYICKDCLRSTLEITNNLICPFCRYDHCKQSMDVFTIIDFEHCDPIAWRSWWEKHLELFD